MYITSGAVAYGRIFKCHGICVHHVNRLDDVLRHFYSNHFSHMWWYTITWIQFCFTYIILPCIQILLFGRVLIHIHEKKKKKTIPYSFRATQLVDCIRSIYQMKTITWTFPLNNPNCNLVCVCMCVCMCWQKLALSRGLSTELKAQLNQ